MPRRYHESRNTVSTIQSREAPTQRGYQQPHSFGCGFRAALRLLALAAGAAMVAAYFPTGGERTPAPPPQAATTVHGYEIVREYPHDPEAPDGTSTNLGASETAGRPMYQYAMLVGHNLPR